MSDLNRWHKWHGEWKRREGKMMLTVEQMPTYLPDSRRWCWSVEEGSRRAFDYEYTNVEAMQSADGEAKDIKKNGWET